MFVSSPNRPLDVQSIDKAHYFANSSLSSNSLSLPHAFVEIIEQPASSGVRFRYKCEGRSAGCIRGIFSSEKNKTYPTIKICGYQGSASCIVSCVSKDGPPYYPHPHNLVGKQTSGNGVCFKTINTADMICSFPNLGIQCVKKKDIKDSLFDRKKLQIDPFGTGFSNCKQLNKINLNAVRLCFQVFIADSNGKICIPLPPVVSNPIYDNKTVSDLTITKLSHNSSSAIGGQQIILLCDQINKDDIEVLFYEEKDGSIVWSSEGKFLPQHVHRKAAIVVTTPPYKTTNISQPLEVFIQLRRPSDCAVGKPVTFTYLPLKYDPEGMLQKTRKCETIRFDKLLQSIEKERSGSSERIIKKAIRSNPQKHSELYSKNNFCNSVDIKNVAPVFQTNKDCALEPFSYVKQEVNLCKMLPTLKNNDVVGNNEIFYESTAVSEEAPLDNFNCLNLDFDSNELDVNVINFDSLSSALNLSLSEIDLK